MAAPWKGLEIDYLSTHVTGLGRLNYATLQGKPVIQKPRQVSFSGNSCLIKWKVSILAAVVENCNCHDQFIC